MKADTSRWVESKSIIIIEVYKGKPKGRPRDIRITYCLDHSGNLDKAAEKNREAIYKKSKNLNLSDWVDQDWKIPKYKKDYIHLHKAVLWSRGESNDYSEFSSVIKHIATSAIENAGKFLTDTLPDYDKVVTEASLETAKHSNAAPER